MRATDFFITHKYPPSSAGPEPAAVGPVASTLTTRPPRAAIIYIYIYIHTHIHGCCDGVRLCGPAANSADHVSVNMEQRWNDTDRTKLKFRCASLSTTDEVTWTALGVSPRLRVRSRWLTAYAMARPDWSRYNKSSVTVMKSKYIDRSSSGNCQLDTGDLRWRLTLVWTI
jgi:hypothetical protein